MRRAVLVIACALGSLFLVLFLGGLTSAALEVRREKRAGVPVTRPAWDRARARRASGGRFAYLRGLVKGLRSTSPADPTEGPCPACGSTVYVMDDRPTGCVWVCLADLNGRPDAEAAHDAYDGSTWAQRHDQAAAS